MCLYRINIEKVIFAISYNNHNSFICNSLRQFLRSKAVLLKQIVRSIITSLFFAQNQSPGTYLHKNMSCFLSKTLRAYYFFVHQ